MKYSRPAYLDKGVKITKSDNWYGGDAIDVPFFEGPISSTENFRRMALRENPLWVPASVSEFQTVMAQDVVTNDVRGRQVHTDFRRKATVDYDFTDWFNTEWTWVCSAGGAMLKPGTMLLDDITKWEKEIKWPELSEWDFKETAAKYMKEQYDPAKIMHYDIGRGCTERLVSILGGYSEAMLSLAVEPEAVLDFLNRFAEFEIELFDTINSLYPLNAVTYHDDWGTERDTFFSEKMFEEIVFAPSKRIIDHIRSKGVAFILHSCGNITRFLPYAVELHADFLQIQRRAVDIPLMKQKYGDKIGFNTGIEGVPFGEPTETELLSSLVRDTVDMYAKGGGFFTSVMGQNPRQTWDLLAELNAYSREYYEAQ
jgi:hypothetical protein